MVAPILLPQCPDMCRQRARQPEAASNSKSQRIKQTHDVCRAASILDS